MISFGRTVASRIMLPTYMVLFFGLGVGYIFTSPVRRDDSPALQFANSLMPLAVWGVLFLVCAGLMMLAVLRRKTSLFQYALWIGIVAMIVWTIVFGAAAVFGHASSTTWMWPAFTARCCFASYRSLATEKEES